MTNIPSLSIVVPVFNEEENVLALHEEINKVCVEQNYDYEIIFVDDGSTDKTVKTLKTLSPVIIVGLRKNFGQTAAMDAGIKKASKDLVITMDGDRQNNPVDIPRLIDELINKDLDVVSGWRKNRKDPFLKNFVSRGAYAIRRLLINDGIHDSGCTLKVYKRECFENVSLYGEMHRFIPAILKIKGFKVGELVVNHRPRVAGITKYNFSRTLKGLIDMVAVWFWNKFAVRPLHLLGGLGIFFILLGLLSVSITIIYFIQGQGMSETAWPLLSMFFLLTGMQLFIFGLMADIMIKSYFETTNDLAYSIGEVYESS